MKYLDLRRKVKSAVFSRQDLRLLGQEVFDYQLSLWQKQGHLIKIKNGLYAFEDQRANILPEEISALLYSPSYLSLERALSVYGFIPEIVYAVTAVTPKITRRFKNQFGFFVYRHIKPALFFGYKEMKGEKLRYLLAEPEKALLDFIYFNQHRLKSPEEAADFRFNRSQIKENISPRKLNKYLAVFNSVRMEEIASWIINKK